MDHSRHLSLGRSEAWEARKQTRMVKKLDRVERRAASSCFLPLPFSTASIRPTIRLLLNSINREKQNGLRSHAGLNQRHRRPRAAVAERLSALTSIHVANSEDGALGT